MRYVGNQLNNINNEGTGLISGSSAHFQDYSIDKTLAKQEYTYNANGAMTSDLNKGISSITYNSLNLPTKLTIDNISKGGKAKGTIEYMYSASGVKLRTVHTDNAAIAKNAPILTAGVFATTTDVKTTDYVGNKIYENGKLKQTLIDGGYIKDGKYYYYLTDHLGNNRAVAEATTGTLLQKTHYYPFGMAFAETTGEQEQPFKYNGKELDREMQLNTYDYAARYMDPSIGRFTSIDPLAEKKPWLSPYQYGRNNPLRFIDPDGRDEWEINDDGEIKWIQNGKDDAFFRVDADGQRVGDGVTVGKHGTVTYKVSTTTNENDKEIPLISFTFDGDKKGEEVFELLAGNSNVEYSQYKTGDNESGENIIFTNQETNYTVDGGLAHGIYKNGGQIREDIHNHPQKSNRFGIIPTLRPSGLPGYETTGDIPAARNMSEYAEKYKKTSPIFRIYGSSEKKYIKYTPNSVRNDF